MIGYLSAENGKKLRNKVVLLRLDFNTESDWRMKAALPTLRFLAAHAKAVVVLSHKGRPVVVKTYEIAGKPEGIDKKLSLKRDAAQLGRLVNKKIVFISHFDFSKIKFQVAKAKRGSIFVLENLRFLPGEAKNDKKLAKKLAGLGDIYVNDAFAVSHRKNASVVAVTKFLPSYAGFGLQSEIENLGKVMSHAKKPLVVIAGGAKISDKLGLLNKFKHEASAFLMGGALANTLLALRGVGVGKSLIEKNLPKSAKDLLKYRHLILPVDFREADKKLLDIGPRTVDIFSRCINMARTIVWNGPMGMCEKKGFEKGTKAVAEAIAANSRCFSVVGGGETVTALKKLKLDTKMGFISTGGGAMLEYLSGKKLPGIEALNS